MHELARGLLFLTIIGGVCGGLLHAANAFTKDAITNNRQQAAQRMVAELVGPDKAQSMNLYAAQAGSCVAGLLIKQTVVGYAGPIEFLLYREIGTDSLKVRTTQHRETPGIGDFIDSQRDDYLSEKDGASLSVWQALDNVSGATVTSAALQKAVRRTLRQVDLQCAADA